MFMTTTTTTTSQLLIHKPHFASTPARPPMAASSGGAGLGVVARIDAHASGTAEDRRRAQSALERAVRRASASMRKRGWVVERLTELAPKIGAVKLWGDNSGAGKRVRLCVRQKIARGRGSSGRGSSGRSNRANANRASSSFRWIDEDQVFAVFLHELAHIERGPHDAKFYKILNELKAEAELRMADDFYVCGRCVGGAATAASPRTAAARAAMKRRRDDAARSTTTRGRRSSTATTVGDTDVIEILD